jgi:hypothetical protein
MSYCVAMPRLRSHRRERFALGLAEGKKSRDAYVDAGFKSVGREAIDAAAARLKADPEVKARLAELQHKHARIVAVSVESLVAELDAMRQKAIDLKQISAGVQAIMGKAKLLGMITDKVDMEATLRKPSRVPTDRRQMTVEEWETLFVPAHLKKGSTGSGLN